MSNVELSKASLRPNTARRHHLSIIQALCHWGVTAAQATVKTIIGLRPARLVSKDSTPTVFRGMTAAEPFHKCLFYQACNTPYQ